jgi:hypothetical protein
VTGSGPATRTLEQTLTTARLILGAMVGTLVLVAALCLLLPRGPWGDFLIAPAGIVGIVSPAIGYRLFHWFGERLPQGAGDTEREASFLRASVLAVSVTEGSALLGIVTFAMTGALTAMIGVVSHMILTGALWPTEDRLEFFVAQSVSARDDP